MGARNIYISLLAFVFILAPGGILFRDSEPGSFAVEFVAFAVCFTLLHTLDARERRRKQER